MSHVVLARRSNDRSEVEAIEEVVSVDAVMYPATTQTFRESTDHSEDEMQLLRQERDGLLKQLQQTREELTTFQERQLVETKRLQMLSESGLPDFAITDEFREILLKEEDEQRCRAFIEERKQLIRQSSARRPSSRSRKETGEAVNDLAIVNLIRGRQGGSVLGVK